MPVGTATERSADLVRSARRIVVVTGAGISTDSGIPDYRGPSGLWTKDPSAMRLVNLPDYLADADLRRAAWARRVAHPAFTAEPNAAHLALVTLAGRGALSAVLTQNIDGLHQRSGLPDDLVLELHGDIRRTECVTCGEKRPMAEAADRVRSGEADPDCRRCGGILKSATVFFGQSLDRELVAHAARLLADADLVWVIGSSLRVQPVAHMVAGADAPLVITNADPTPYDARASAIVRDPIGQAVPAIVGRDD